MQKTVLVVEDDFAIRQGIVDALDYEGYETLEAETGDKGLAMALDCEYDLMLLDLVLPGAGGFTILEEVRKVRPTHAVIILTAKGEEADRVKGLRMGADDYVVKPFSVKELMARVQTVLRRAPERPRELKKIEIAGGTIDLQKSEIHFQDGEIVSLSEKERELLQYLAENSQRAISREEMLSRVWGFDPKGIETRTIDMHIARLREKLRDSKNSILKTVRGKGYLFVMR